MSKIYPRQVIVTKFKIINNTDVLVHSGDFTYTGKYNEVKDFVDWLGELVQ